MRSLVTLIVATLPFFECFGQTAAPELYTNNSLVTVSASQVFGMPAALTNPTVVTDFGRDVSKISFDLRVPNSTTHAVQVLVLVFDMTGEVKGGESWPIGGQACATSPSPGAVAPVSSGKYTQVLGHQLKPADHVVVLVSRVVADGNTYEAPVKEFVDPSVALTARVVARPTASFTGSSLPVPELYCGPDFCDGCAITAVNMCGAKGVKSFQCVVSTCSCAFTCCQSPSSC